MNLNENKLICSTMTSTESGRVYNAVIETLALSLFQDDRDVLVARSSGRAHLRAWHELRHDERQRFREMAQGHAYLGGLS